jgi:hypothetical protein
MDNDRVFEDFYKWVAIEVECDYIIENNKVTFINENGDKICKFYGKNKMVVHRPNGKVRVYKNWTIMSFYKIVDVIAYR